MEQENAGEGRDEQGRFKPGVSGNPKGMEKQTEEQKLNRKATAEVVKAYKEGLEDKLTQLGDVIIQKALDGDLGSLKEINDRVMGKAPQPQEHSGELRVLVVPEEVAKKMNE